MKTYRLTAFAGVRNDISPERFKEQEDATGRTDLSKGTNIELDESGKPLGRLGTTAIDATASHSLWANDELAYLVRGGTLRQLNPDMSITDLGVSIQGNRVCYQRVGNDVFFTDQLRTGVVGTSGYRPWGVQVPPQPVITPTLGDMRAGMYLVTITYLRRDDHESGASPVRAMTLTANQGLSISLPISFDPLVDRVRIYVSDANGEVPYLVATELNVGGTSVITALPADRSLAVRTLRCGPAPAGQVVGYYKGRVYVADGPHLWYSLPYQYELFHRAENFITFTSVIKTFSPVYDGIFLGTEDDVSFLHGDDPANFTRTTVSSSGSVLGTEVVIPSVYFGDTTNPRPVSLWMGKNGLCVGYDGGTFRNLTGGRYILPHGLETGASLLKIRGASPQLVTTLFS